MRDASVRRRFEKEVELTLAWEAEKVIVERFAGDCSLMGMYNVPSTSAFDFEPNSAFYEDIDSNEGEFIWSQSGGGELSSGKRLQTELNGGILNSQFLEVLSKGDYSDQTCQLDATKTAINEGKLRATCGSPPSDEPSKEFVNPREAISAAGMDSGKENRFICATCGFLGNNRKALYRHGVKSHHLVRVLNSAGSLACKYCPFRTNKTFNFNRHMKRFHSDE
ncbi:zinc finger, C2H2 type [Ancylostoma caninum]|uniref:Zinc finger, C2H2 type n=1 Tax=Ancylostoma caninum TaxID=29170 RepID=A0A368G4R4_ANCCA|nr:zinc finger, C2H2 type [Ancylostoma caninum]